MLGRTQWIEGTGLTKPRLKRDAVCIQLCRCDDEVCGLLVLQDWRIVSKYFRIGVKRKETGEKEMC